MESIASVLVVETKFLFVQWALILAYTTDVDKPTSYDVYVEGRIVILPFLCGREKITDTRRTDVVVTRTNFSRPFKLISCDISKHTPHR
jgi:hypothetical protein